MLTPAQLKAREGRVTASFAPALLAGNAERILNEWRRLVGDPAYAEEDFSDNWPVQFGSYIETFALDWHERRTGRPLSRRGEVVYHPRAPHVCATLDSFRADDGCVIDCKAVGAFRKLDEVCAHYTAQMIVQKACASASCAALLIVHGGAEPQEHAVAWEPDYEAEVWRRIAAFWECVESLTPPVALAPVAAPVKPAKSYDMSLSNMWASAADDWLTHRTAARKFDHAARDLKELVAADAMRAFGHGVEAVRNKAGSLTIKPLEA